jgi:hypothetical protein
MADVRISQLPQGTADPDGILPVVNAAGTVTQRVRVGDIVALAGTIQGPIGPPGPAGESVSFATGSTAPANPRAGDLWLDGNGVLNVYDGTAWAPVSSSGGTTNIVSTTTPAPGTVEGELWINPDGTLFAGVFSNAEPPVYTDTAVVEQASGEPIGLSADGLSFSQPELVAAVPIDVGGKRYLLPLIEASAASLAKTPAFTFSDQPITTQSNGQPIGFSADGSSYAQPEIVAAIPIVVDGRRYMLPLIEE